MPRIFGRVRGLVAAAAAALALGGCTNLYLVQDPKEMLVRVGNDRLPQPAAPSSDRFLDYALLAEQSYQESLYDTPSLPFDLGPDTYCETRQRPGEDCRDVAGLTGYARKRLAGWRRVYAKIGVGNFRCPADRLDCANPLDGLGVQVWMRRGRVCPEAAIVFRGTDGGSSDDWLSNLRWLLRLLPLYDQYDQVQAYVPEFVRAIEDQGCFVPGRTRITAVGHSLGGGLAQNAAFADGRIRAVTAFDPSFVTGASDLKPEIVAANGRGLAIERIYEHGEILAYPRFLLRQLAPYSTCDPRIRTVRLNTIRGSPLEQHSLNSMTTALLGWSKREREAGRRADREPDPSPSLSCPEGAAGAPKVL